MEDAVCSFVFVSQMDLRSKGITEPEDVKSPDCISVSEFLNLCFLFRILSVKKRRFSVTNAHTVRVFVYGEDGREERISS